jgi:hypothetical protein
LLAWVVSVIPTSIAAWAAVSSELCRLTQQVYMRSELRLEITSGVLAARIDVTCSRDGVFVTVRPSAFWTRCSLFTFATVVYGRSSDG